MESNLEKVFCLGEPRSVALKESYLEKLSKKEFSAPPPLYHGEVPAREAGEPGTESSNPNGLFFWKKLLLPCGESLFLGLAVKLLESKK